MARMRFNALNVVDMGVGIVLKINVPMKYKNAVQTILSGFKAGNEYDIEPHKEKRSLSANAYFWVIADKIAQAIRSDKMAVYRDLIKRVGVFDTLAFPAINGDEEEAIKAMNRFKANWTKHGDGFLTRTIDKDKRIVEAYYGSSRYNTAEMSRLIDEAIKDAKELGIEIKPQWEIDAMLKEWSNKQQ